MEESDLAAEGAAGPSGAEVAAALAAEAAARGYTPKAGPTRLHYWTAANRTARHEQFTRWVDETTEHPDSGLAADTSGDVRLPRLQPVYPNCQVLVVRASAAGGPSSGPLLLLLLLLTPVPGRRSSRARQLQGSWAGAAYGGTS